MSILWIIEDSSSLSGDLSLVKLFVGNYSVRAFASIKSFLRLTTKVDLPPNMLIIRWDQFSSEAANVSSVVQLRWPGCNIIIAGFETVVGITEANHFVNLNSLFQDPFCIQRFGRSHIPQDHHITLDELIFDFSANRLKKRAEEKWTHLTLKESQLLKYLVKHLGCLLSYEDICLEVWKGIKISPRSLSTQISRLRRYIAGSNLEIVNAYGGGYQLNYLDK